MTDETKQSECDPKAPEYIYLQDGGRDREDHSVWDEDNHEDLTWCETSMENDDTKYIRFDLHERELSKMKEALIEAKERIKAFQYSPDY